MASEPMKVRRRQLTARPLESPAEAARRPCPACGDGNYASDTVCMGCGASLLPPAGKSAPGAAPSEEGAPAMKAPPPGRGTAGAALDPMLGVIAPPGWLVTPLPDGAVCLTRTVWARLNRAGGGIALCLFGSAMLASTLLGPFLAMSSFGRGARPDTLAWALIWGFAAVAGALTAAGRLATLEEWIVARDYLEVRRSLLSFSSRRVHTGGALRTDVGRRWSGRQRSTVQRLIVVSFAGLQVIESVTTSSLFSGLYTDALHQLGAYLAAHTGWEFTPSTDHVAWWE